MVRTITRAGEVAANLPGKTLNRALQLLEGTISMLPGVSADRYAPVEFVYGSDTLTAESLIYLDQLGARMREHESLVVALCGRSVSRDAASAAGRASEVDKLFAEARKGVYREYAPGRDGLLRLAETRADNVRRYLHGIHRIPESRLQACDVHIDPDVGAKPRVDLRVKTPAGSKGFFDSFF
jgi:hypothetical protein